jgi:YqcI/YcgG family
MRPTRSCVLHDDIVGGSVTGSKRTRSTQERVRLAIGQVGGYWRPSAAAVRLLEELGELGEVLEHPAQHTEVLTSELADLWIISTAIADQFLADAGEPVSRRYVGDIGDAFRQLVVTAGTIARIINYYDGPKTPQTLKDWCSLGEAVVAFHDALANVSSGLCVDLEAAVSTKLRAIPARDAGRFVSGYDPSTAACLDRFRVIQAITPCPYADQARIWGAPSWSSESIAANVKAIVSSFTMFTKAAIPEQLDAYVILGPAFAAMDHLAQWFVELLQELSGYDPAEERVMEGQVSRRGWQFAFNGQRVFIAVFSPLYDLSHPRHSPTETLVFMQVEQSFDRRGVGANHPHSRQVKEQIRQLFADAGRVYSAEAKDARVEAPLYLLPRWEDDADVRWWEGLSWAGEH